MKNCPLGHFECEFCQYKIGDTCTQSGIEVSIYDLMTHAELVTELTKQLKLPGWSKRQWGFVRQLEARIIHFEHKLMELQAKKKQTSVDYEVDV